MQHMALLLALLFTFAYSAVVSAAEIDFASPLVVIIGGDRDTATSSDRHIKNEVKRKLFLY